MLRVEHAADGRPLRKRVVGPARDDTKGSAVHGLLGHVHSDQAMTLEQAIERIKRPIGEVAVTEGIELPVGHDRQRVVELEDEVASGSQRVPHTRDEVVGVRNVGEQVVVDDDRRSLTAGLDPSCGLVAKARVADGDASAAEIRDQGRGSLGDDGVDAQFRQELMQVAAMAGDFDDRLDPWIREAGDLGGKSARVIAHGRRLRRRRGARFLGLHRDVADELDEAATRAHRGPQRPAGLRRWIGGIRVVAGERLKTEIEDRRQGSRPARSTEAVDAHVRIPLWPSVIGDRRLIDA